MTTSSPSSAGMLWTGRVLSGLGALALLASAAMKLSHSTQIVDSWTAFGFPIETLTPIGVEELLSTILYLIPQTSLLGLVLLTGHLGGAIATHVHAGQNFAPPLIVALLVWGGLYLRESRLRALLPLRSQG